MDNERNERNERITVLMQRYCQLGRLLKDEPDIDDAMQVAEAKIILDEMADVESEIDAMLLRHSQTQ